MSAEGAKPYYHETWFEPVFTVACLVVLFLLFHGLMPSVEINPNVIQTVAMSKLFAEGRFADAFSRFNMPPIYPLLLALVIKIRHTSELPRLIESFQTMNLVLAMLSAGLVHYFVRRQIPKHYAFIITGLYVLAPSTLGMAWSLSPQMTYMVLSMSTLIVIDISLSKESVMGGQLSRGEVILCGLFLSLTILSWQVGYLLMLAFMVVMLKRFGLKKSLQVTAGIMLCISPFIARDIFYVVRSPQEYTQSSTYIMQSVRRHGIFKTVGVYADNIMLNLARNAIGELNLSSLDRIAQTPRTTTPNRIGLTEKVWVRWLVGIVATVGAIYGLSQYTGVGSIYMCIYVITAMALLPSAGLTLAPLLPLLLFYLYCGLIRTGQWMHRLDMPLLTRIAAPVLTVWILLCTLTNLLSHAGSQPMVHQQTREALHAPKVMYMSTPPQPETRLEEAQTTSAQRRAMDWLKAHSSESARVGAARPEAASLLADDKSASPAVKAERQKALATELGQYDYLVEEGATKLTPASSAASKGLKMVYEDVPGRIRIWRVRPAL
jgi:hypothetical protein